MELVLYVTFICFLLLDKQPQTLELDGVVVVWNGGEGGAELVSGCRVWTRQIQELSCAVNQDRVQSVTIKRTT